MREIFPFSAAFAVLVSILATPASAFELPQQEYVTANSNSQNWSADEYTVWYGKTQGSRLIPYSWFTQLKDSETGLPFGSFENMSRFNYPYFRETNGLPIGFLTDIDENGEAWIGMNCSACHTSIISKGEKSYLFHAGQSMGDFRGLVSSLSNSVRALYEDPAQMSALGIDPQAVEDWLHERGNLDKVLDGAANWGPGRLDAVGYIAAKTAYLSHDFDRDPSFHLGPANAPVNPPPIWNAAQQQRVQYSGFVEIDYDKSKLVLVQKHAFFRNYIQTLSTFSSAEMSKNGKLESSVNFGNLIRLENALSKLSSPVWPEDLLGEIDHELAARGREIYFGKEAKCSGCHSLLDSSDTASMILEKSHKDFLPDGPFIRVIPAVTPVEYDSAFDDYLAGLGNVIGTDATQICNSRVSLMPTGKLEGVSRNHHISNQKENDPYIPFGENAYMLDILAQFSTEEFRARKPEILAAIAEQKAKSLFQTALHWYQPGRYFDDTENKLTPIATPSFESNTLKIASYEQDLGDYREILKGCVDNKGMFGRFYGYKARPLNGIWATAPFLHNGSVPYLSELLEPQDKRTDAFRFVSYEYDPEKVGYIIATDGPRDFQVYADEAKTKVIPGNWNGGHEYGVNLAPNDKKALIEYLKTL